MDLSLCYRQTTKVNGCGRCMWSMLLSCTFWTWRWPESVRFYLGFSCKDVSLWILHSIHSNSSEWKFILTAATRQIRFDSHLFWLVCHGIKTRFSDILVSYCLVSVRLNHIWLQLDRCFCCLSHCVNISTDFLKWFDVYSMNSIVPMICVSPINACAK